ncbi:GEVED domain-containing protein, partial [Aequorivita echinoideorum]
PGGIGNEVYWYDAQTGGNLVAVGPTLETPVLTATTSYWAEEVYIEGGAGTTSQNYCIPTYPTGCSASDDIDDFIMAAAGINHIGSGCSTNGYGDFRNTSIIGAIQPGQTYNFEATHNFSSQWMKIWIDFDKNGSFEDVGELLFSSTSGSNNTNGSITIPVSAQNGATVMRIMDRYAGLPTSSCNPGGTWGETHDYTVIIGSLLCQSDRVEAVAEVNNTLPAPPAGDAAQQFCGNENTVADLDVT